MPFITPNYKLTAFQRGEPYSAKTDQSRLLIIDNQLKWLSDLCGDGVVNGWDISSSGTSREISVSVGDGFGLIDGIITRTFGELTTSLEDNSTVYLFMQKKKDFLGGGGSFSSIFTLPFIDVLAPNVPTNLAMKDSDYNVVELLWDENTEKDFSYYIIYRDGNQIGTSEENSYIDNNINEQTAYIYNISSVDTSGNESAQSVAFGFTTLANLNPPLNPGYPFILEGDSYVQIAWDAPEIGNIKEYNISVYDITDADCTAGISNSLSWFSLLISQWYALTVDQYESLMVTEVSSSIIFVEKYSTTDTNIIINSLENGRKYLFILYSLSDNDIFSTGISTIAVPKRVLGPEEVLNLNVSQSSGTNNREVLLEINWTPGVNPYKPLAEKFVITIIENGSVVSDPITIYNGTSVIIKEYPYGGSTRAILSETFYIIKVQGIDADNNYNIGIVDSVKTSRFYSPASPTNIKSKITNEKNLLFVWQNSIDDFEYNNIIVKKTDLTTAITTDIVIKTNYGKKRSYIIIAPISLNTTYTIYLQSVDKYGNKSSTISWYYTSALQNDLNLPIPKNQYGFSSDGSVLLVWEDPSPRTAEYYKIWRAKYSTDIVSSGFSLIETIPSEYQFYIDYSASNGEKYYYFVTKIDIYGKESNNPVDDDYHYYPMCYTYPHTNGIISSVSGVYAENSGLPNDFDVVIEWTIDNDSFDGYEIYRSNINKYSWEKIGYTDKKVASFIDRDALTDGTGNYCYMVRKFKNEARLVKSYSNILPTASVLLCKITTLFGNVTIEDMRDDISQLASVVENYLDYQIDNHKHNLGSDADRRINLSKNVIITDWVTTDNKLFLTTKDFSGANSYIVKIDEEIPSVFYEINETFKTIIFAEEVESTNISLECVGLSETDGDISKPSISNVFKNIVDNISATQSQSGKLRDAQIPVINHAGRVDEKLIPIQTRMTTENGYIFKIYQNENSDVAESIGQSITFYDISSVVIDSSCWEVFTINLWFNFTEEDWNDFEDSCSKCKYVIDCSDPAVSCTSTSCIYRLVAATSNGVMISNDVGETWENVLIVNGTSHTIYLAPFSNRVFAITNDEIYESDNGMTWAKTEGLNNVGMIRDIVEDNLWNIYISTDLGVYILKQLDIGDYLVWKQSSIIDKETSNVYALFLDSSFPYVSDRVIASTEIGFFETTNYGDTWSYISDFAERTPVYQFLSHNANIFCVSKGSIWRKSPSNLYYTNIGNFDTNDSIKFLIYNDKIFISTDYGLIASMDNYDIDNSLYIEFEKILPIINFSSKVTPVTSLNTFGNLILVGTDQILFKGESINEIVEVYSSTTGTIPTIYVDGEEKQLGCFYDINSNTLSFIDRIDDNSIVTVANQYNLYRSSYEGWIDQSYSSPFELKNNGVVIFSFNGAEIEDIIGCFNTVAFESFSEANSNSVKAIEYSNKFETDLLRLIGIDNGTASLEDGETIQNLVSEIVDNYNKTYSQVLGKIRFASLVDFNDQVYTIFNFEKVLSSLTSSLLSKYELVSNLPAIQLSATTGTMNISDGVIIFGSPFNKYDILRITIEGTSLSNIGSNTHTEIDDHIDGINSGLSMSLADVHQSNILKMEMFFDREIEDSATVSNNVYNTYYVSPILSSEIDTLNSTVGYTVENENSEIAFTVKYPTAVEYLVNGGVVAVGYDKGIIYVDTVNYSLSAVIFNEFGDDEFVRDLYYDNENENSYLLTNRNLYISSDGGVSWNRQQNVGLDTQLRKVTFIRDNIIVAADDGIYYKSPLNSDWKKSLNIENTSILLPSTVLYVVANNTLYYGYDGISWSNGGSFGDTQINEMVPYRCDIAMATSSGYRRGSGTMFGNVAQASMVDLLSDVSQSESLEFNDLDADNHSPASTSSELTLGANDGTYWIINGNSYTQYTDSELTCIHKVLYVGTDAWLFGFDNLKLPGVVDPIKLSIGMAF